MEPLTTTPENPNSGPGNSARSFLAAAIVVYSIVELLLCGALLFADAYDRRDPNSSGHGLDGKALVYAKLVWAVGGLFTAREIRNRSEWGGVMTTLLVLSWTVGSILADGARGLLFSVPLILLSVAVLHGRSANPTARGKQ